MKKTQVTVPNVEVGKDLVAVVNVSLPAPVSAETGVTLTVGDSTKALLSLDSSSTGMPQITTTIPHGSGGLTFYVQGLAAAGQTTITVSVAGLSDAVGTVTLDASGFYWASDAVSVGLGNTFESYLLLAGPLDATSLLPVDSQPLRPGAMDTPTLEDSNPAVLMIGQNPITFFVGLSSLALTGVTNGSATLTLQQPAGFSTPSVRQTLAVTVGSQ